MLRILSYSLKRRKDRPLTIYGRVYLIDESTGKRSKREHALRATTTREAKKELIEWVQHLDITKPTAPAPLLCDVIQEFIVMRLNSGHFSGATVENYITSFKHIKKRYSALRLDKLNYKDVNMWYSEMLQAGASTNKVLKIDRLLRMVYEYARKARITDKDPMELVVPPKPKKKKPGITKRVAKESPGRCVYNR